jgi:hypothetical protein
MNPTLTKEKDFEVKILAYNKNRLTDRFFIPVLLIKTDFSGQAFFWAVFRTGKKTGLEDR